MAVHDRVSMVEIEQLATESIGLYQKTATLLLNIRDTQQHKNAVENGPATNKTITVLQQMIEKCDNQLLSHLANLVDTPSDNLKKLLNIRSSLIENLITLNQEIVAEATRMRALLKNELQSINSGRGAIRGYSDTTRLGQNRFHNSC